MYWSDNPKYITRGVDDARRHALYTWREFSNNENNAHALCGPVYNNINHREHQILNLKNVAYQFLQKEKFHELIKDARSANKDPYKVRFVSRVVG